LTQRASTRGSRFSDGRGVCASSQLTDQYNAVVSALDMPVVRTLGQRDLVRHKIRILRPLNRFRNQNEITVEIAFTPTTGGCPAQQIAYPAGGLLEEKFENRLLEPTNLFPFINLQAKRYVSDACFGGFERPFFWPTSVYNQSLRCRNEPLCQYQGIKSSNAWYPAEGERLRHVATTRSKRSMYRQPQLGSSQEIREL
jgi:hypothetical protein